MCGARPPIHYDEKNIAEDKARIPACNKRKLNRTIYYHAKSDKELKTFGIMLDGIYIMLFE